MSSERFIQLAYQAVVRSPELLKCSPESLIVSIMKAAEIGLEPTGSAGGHLVPMRTNVGYVASFIPDYRALIRLAIQSGSVASVESHVVRSGDTFSYTLGLDKKLLHIPSLAGDGEITHVYAIAWLPPGCGTNSRFEIMTKSEIDGVAFRRKRDGGPWHTDYGEMARKTVIKRLLKHCAPGNERVQKAIEADFESEESGDENNKSSTNSSKIEDVKSKLSHANRT